MALTSPIRSILVLAAAFALPPFALSQSPLQEELRSLHADAGIACLCRVRAIQPTTNADHSRTITLTLLTKRSFKGAAEEVFTLRLRGDAGIARLRPGKTYLLFAFAPQSGHGSASFVRGDAGIIEIGADPRIAWPSEALPIRGSPRRLRRAETAATAAPLPEFEQVIEWLEAFSRERSLR